MDIRIVSIGYDTFKSDLDCFMNNFTIKYVPYVCYVDQKKNEPPHSFVFPKPFTLISPDIPISLIDKFYKKNYNTDDYKKVAEISYSSIIRYAQNSAEKIVADYVSAIVKEFMCTEYHTIFIIKNSISSKLMGRLSSLFMNNRNNTVLFLTYQAIHLFTNFISTNKEKMVFDLHMNLIQEEKGIIGPFPSNIEDSLTQTFFLNYKRESSNDFLPIRIDLFSQGLSEMDIPRKRELILNHAFSADSVLPMPVENHYTKIPKSFKLCIDFLSDHAKKNAEEILRG